MVFIKFSKKTLCYNLYKLLKLDFTCGFARQMLLLKRSDSVFLTEFEVFGQLVRYHDK